MTDAVAGQQGRSRHVPLWRRIAVGSGLTVAGVVLLVHLYALALTFLPVPGTILMTQRGLAGADVRRDWTNLDDISPHLVRAVIAAEDAGFCAHGGIDWEAIEKAREFNRRNEGKRRRGGSTISQQTAKNVFFWNGGGMARKAGEAWMTLVIEKVWGKPRIMEMYLNVAEWGDGLFGAEAAAQARFGKSAADLTAQEAALLAAVLPSPNKWRADKPGPYVQRRSATIRSRMNVVRDEGLAACAFGGTEPDAKPRPQPQDGTPTPPRPVLPDLPPAPETGDEALGVFELPDDGPGQAPESGADEALNDVLDAADETFGAPDRATDEPAPTETANDTGPVDLRPEPAGPLPDDPLLAEPLPEPDDPAPQ